MAKILFETGKIAQLEECLLSMDKALSLIQNSTRTHTCKRKDVGILSEQAVFDMGGGGKGHSHNKDSNASDPGKWQSLPWGKAQRDGKAFFRSECKICPPRILLLKVYDLETSPLQKLTTSASSFGYI